MATIRKTKATAPATPAAPINKVSDCVFNNNSAANEHTRAAIVAIAEAARANANALEAAAEALSRGHATNQVGLRIGG